MTKKFISLLVFLVILSGCVTQLSSEEVNTSSVMPESVAVKIFQKYGYLDVRQKLNSVGRTLCSKSTDTISITEIEHFKYWPSQKKVDMSTGGICYQAVSVFGVEDMNDAKELLKAARALGANVDKVFVIQPFWKY